MRSLLLHEESTAALLLLLLLLLLLEVVGGGGGGGSGDEEVAGIILINADFSEYELIFKLRFFSHHISCCGCGPCILVLLLLLLAPELQPVHSLVPQVAVAAVKGFLCMGKQHEQNTLANKKHFLPGPLGRAAEGAGCGASAAAAAAAAAPSPSLVCCCPSFVPRIVFGSGWGQGGRNSYRPGIKQDSKIKDNLKIKFKFKITWNSQSSSEFPEAAEKTLTGEEAELR